MTRAQTLENDLQWFSQWQQESTDTRHIRAAVRQALGYERITRVCYVPSEQDKPHLWNCGGI